MENQALTFELEKETKQTVRYHETTDPAGIGLVYIQKHWLKKMFGEYPQKIQIEVTAVMEQQ